MPDQRLQRTREAYHDTADFVDVFFGLRGAAVVKTLRQQTDDRATAQQALSDALNEPLEPSADTPWGV